VTGYDRLLELARRERELIDRGRWDEVVALDHERRELAAALPGPPPPEAREALAAAERQVRENAALIAAALAETREQLAGLARGSRQAAAYLAGPPVATSLDARG
jgi:hypothetical protein